MGPPTTTGSPILSFNLSFSGQLSTVSVRSALSKWGTISAVSPFRPGTYLVKLVPLSGCSVEKILQTTVINGSQVSIVAFQKSCSGTVFFREFSTWSNDEIKEQLSETCTFIKRLPTKNCPTDTSARVLISFNSAEVPEKITLECGVMLSVRRHTPPPLRCGRCHIFNHHTDSCNNSARCARCGSPEHTRAACSAVSPCCPACKGEHEVDDRKCPAWTREWEIKKIRMERGISTTEAKTVYKDQKGAPHRPVAPPAPQRRPVAEQPTFTAPPQPPKPSDFPALAAPANKWRTPAEIPAPPTTASTCDKDDRLLKLLEAQNKMLQEITTQNSKIIEMLTVLVLRNIPAPAAAIPQATSPTSTRKRLRRDAEPQKKSSPVPADSPEKDQSSSGKKTLRPVVVYNLGRDNIASPSASNIATFDFKEKEN